MSRFAPHAPTKGTRRLHLLAVTGVVAATASLLAVAGAADAGFFHDR